jgi:centriolin
MEEKRAKQTQGLTSELILSTAGADELSAVITFKFKSAVKLRVRSNQAIENLGGCVNLQELDLSYHLISRIEGLEGLTQLRELNLAENNIRKLENLEPCRALEVLNLTGNQIKELPRTALEPLQKLRVVRIARNRVSGLNEVGNLAVLERLEVLVMHGNPVESEGDFQLFAAFHLQSLKSLEGSAITQNIKTKAQRKFSPQSMEAWAIRENLVSYRRNLSDMQQRRRNIAEEAVQSSAEIVSIEKEQTLVEEELERTNKEMLDVQLALDGRSNDQLANKKQTMRELITEAERLRDDSLGMQRQIAANRDNLVELERKLKKVRGETEQERNLLNEMENLSRLLERDEGQYGSVVDQLSAATEAISVLEEEIIGLQRTPRWVEVSKSYPIDYNTEMYLLARQDQIKSKLPQLKSQLVNLQQRIRLLRQRRSDLDSEQRRTDEQIASYREKINECELFLQKGPASPGGKTKMWESLKSVMSSGPQTSLEETDKTKDNDLIVQLSAQQRIDQAQISLLQTKLAELNEEKLRRNSPDAEIERLNHQFTKQTEELKWACEQIDKVARERDNAKAKLEAAEDHTNELRTQCTQALKQVEDWKQRHSELAEELGQQVSLEQLELKETQQKIAKARQHLGELQGKVREVEEKYEATAMDMQTKVKELNKTFYEQSEQLQDLDTSLRRKQVMHAELQRTLQTEQQMAEDLTARIEDLRRKKRQEEVELGELQAEKSVMSAEKAAIRQVGEVLGLRGELVSSHLEEVLRDLERKLEKASRFKKNKEKFLEMYEASTQDLKAEWDTLNSAKNQTAQEMVRGEGDLEHLLKQRTALEAQIQTLRTRVESYETTAAKQEQLKEQLSSDWRRINELVEEETQTRNQTRAEVEELSDVLMELREEHTLLDRHVQDLREEVEELEDRRTSLEGEVRGHEEMCRRLAHKMSEEEQSAGEQLLHVTEELTRLRRVIDDLNQHRSQLEENVAAEADKLKEVCARKEAEQDERRAVKERLRMRREKLLEIDLQLQDSERALAVLQRDIATHNADFDARNDVLAAVDKQVQEQRRQLDSLHEQRRVCQERAEQDMRELECTTAELEAAVSNNTQAQAELEALRSDALNYRKEIDALTRTYESRRTELATLENELSDYRQQHKRDAEACQRIEDEVRLRREVLGSLDAKLSGVEAKKVACIEEIMKLSKEFAAEEKRHKSKLHGLKESVVKAENVLVQLRGGVEAERLSLVKLEEDRTRTEEYLRELLYRAEEAVETTRQMEEQSREAKLRLVELREAEDTALVLLAVSGHRIDAKVKERITHLVRCAQELATLKENVRPKQDESSDQSMDFNKLVPETNELKKLLANLEATQERLRALTPIRDLSL